MNGLVVGNGDKFYQCDNCGAVHHVAEDALPLTPECPEMSGCIGGPVTEITHEEALEVLG